MPILQRHAELAGALALFLLLVAAYSFSVGLRATRGASITGDEPFYLLTTQSLLDDGDLDLRNQYERESYRSFFDHSEPLWRQMVPTPNGSLLSPHDPGLSILVLPGFALAGLRGAQVELMLLAALTMALTYLLVARETQKPLLSWLIAGAVGLSATLFVYSTEIYPEFPAALCLVISLLLVRSDSASVSRGLLLAALLSSLAWLGIKYVPLGLIVAIYYLTGTPRRPAVWFLAASALSGVVYVSLHYLLFGDLTPYSVNTVHEGAPALDVLQAHLGFEDRLYRTWGLFIDRRFGIGHWAPMFLLVLPALPLLLSHGRMRATVFGLIVAQVLIATFVAITMMGWWFPGRTLVVVTPLFSLVLTIALLRLPSPAQAGLFTLMATSLLFTVLLARAANQLEVVLAVDPFDMRAIPFAWLGKLFPDYRVWDEGTVALTAIWLCIGIVSSLALSRDRIMSIAYRLPRRVTRKRVAPEVA